MYKAIAFFRDTLDMGHTYKVGDVYPRDGYMPSEERVKSLLSGDNRQGKPVIEEIKPVEEENPVEEEKPKKRGKKKE